MSVKAVIVWGYKPPIGSGTRVAVRLYPEIEEACEDLPFLLSDEFAIAWDLAALTTQFERGKQPA